MIKKKCLFISTLVLLNCLSISSTFAEIYKWVDENGKVHYGDDQKNKSGVENSKQVASNVFEVKDHLTVKRIADTNPIVYENDVHSKLIVFSNLSIEIGDGNNDKTFGQVQIGPGCSRGTPLLWEQGHINVDEQFIYDRVVKTFKESNYEADTFSAQAGLDNGLVLNGKIKNLRATVCVPNFNAKRMAYWGHGYNKQKAKSAMSVKINWELKNAMSGETEYSIATEGYHSSYKKKLKPLEESMDSAFEEALAMSIRYLLANETFVGLLTPESNAAPIAKKSVQYKDEHKVLVRHGNQSSTFTRQASELKQSSVTIKTKNGHGSGVIIDDTGFILTNAHVVGSSEKVDVELFDKGIYKGTVLRKHSIRDVALIKIDSIDLASLKTAPISSVLPSVGESLYVIGTPLDEKLSHTVTKGIYSSMREIKGLSFYQTDAAINPGNSGGPVFDEYGNVVALSVAGLFTKGGAGLNVNYLIPIDDALNVLAIDKDTSIVALTTQLSQTVRTGKGYKQLFNQFKLWLDKPVFSF